MTGLQYLKNRMDEIAAHGREAVLLTRGDLTVLIVKEPKEKGRK